LLIFFISKFPENTTFDFTINGITMGNNYVERHNPILKRIANLENERRKEIMRHKDSMARFDSELNLLRSSGKALGIIPASEKRIRVTKWQSLVVQCLESERRNMKTLAIVKRLISNYSELSKEEKLILNGKVSYALVKLAEKEKVSKIIAPGEKGCYWSANSLPWNTDFELPQSIKNKG
jgi:hypothetical protein